MKTASETLPIIADIIRETAASGPVEIGRGTTAAQVRGWDSLSHTMILVNIEERFGVRLPIERVMELASVGELVDLVVEVAGKEDSGRA